MELGTKNKSCEDVKKDIILPKVFIFEGGDVCGKSTQLEEIYKYKKSLNQPIYKFKFPNKIVNFNIKLIENLPFIYTKINDAFEKVKKLGIICDNNEWDIYNIFTALHKYLYNATQEEILNNLSNIEALIKVDIILNGYDKYNWVQTEYKTIVDKQDDSSVILIDRFVDSGSIYNIKLPINYLNIVFNFDYIHESNTIYTKEIEPKMDNLYKLASSINYIIYDEIYKINHQNIEGVNIEKGDFFNKLNRKYTNYETNIEFDNGLFNKNFFTLYFIPSQILYNKFTSEIKNNDVNREVSEYDTNNLLRYLTIEMFNHISKEKYRSYINKNNSKSIQIDLLIEAYNTCCKEKDKVSCIEYCRDILMKKLYLDSK